MTKFKLSISLLIYVNEIKLKIKEKNLILDKKKMCWLSCFFQQIPSPTFAGLLCTLGGRLQTLSLGPLASWLLVKPGWFKVLARDQRARGERKIIALLPYVPDDYTGVQFLPNNLSQQDQLFLDLNNAIYTPCLFRSKYCMLRTFHCF